MLAITVAYERFCLCLLVTLRLSSTASARSLSPHAHLVSIFLRKTILFFFRTSTAVFLLYHTRYDHVMQNVCNFFFKDLIKVKRIQTNFCPFTYTIRIRPKAQKNLVGVNTHMANKIVNHGLNNNLIKELSNSSSIKSEVFFNKETRFDFLIEKNKRKSFIEVKNVTLFRDKKTAEFPDAVTSRGSKHLLTLIDAIKKGYKAYLLFLVQIQNMENFKIASDIDGEYYKNYLTAKKAGVNFLAYRCNISLKKIFIDKKLEIIDA